MKAFLDKISQLTSVKEVVLLNPEGELLYLHPIETGSDLSRQIPQWQQIITSLNRPETVDFIFENGRYYLARIAVGTLLIGMISDDQLKTIKDGCTAVREKLKDSSIRKNVLLRMFSDSRKRLRPAHIKLLQLVAGPEVVKVLSPILDNADRIHSGKGRNLVVATCQVLGHCRTPDALSALKTYPSAYESNSVHRDGVQAAKIAIAQLELDNLHTTPAETDLLDVPVSINVSDTGSPTIEVVRPEDQKIKTLAEQGSKAEAVSLIMASIRKFAGEKNFTEADRYRQMLIAADSMALRDIISAAEIIEEEKSSSLSEALIGTWENLIEELSLEEFSALYFASQPQNTVAGEAIVEQGDFLSNLYFVNSGRVQLYTSKNGRELVFKTVEEGEIFGADCFFDISVWTVSAKSLGASLSVLTWERLAALKQDYPALQNNLLKYCNRFRGYHQFFQKPSTSRRKHERKKLDGRATMEVLDESGNKTGKVARGDLLDISQGGVAFVLRFHRKEYATDLLGKQVNVVIKPEHSVTAIDKNGLVKAVRCHDFVGNDYSVHLQFDTAIDGTKVAQAAAKKSG